VEFGGGAVRQASPDILDHACDEFGLHRPPILTTETRGRLQLKARGVGVLIINESRLFVTIRF
jgi:hypothetical protein